MEPFFERGKIRNEKYAKQLNDFRGLLRRRGITPTDIDGLIDYNGKAFIFQSKRFLAELRTFVWNGPRAEALKGWKR
jgi:hypothetical protein